MATLKGSRPRRVTSGDRRRTEIEWAPGRSTTSLDALLRAANRGDQRAYAALPAGGHPGRARHRPVARRRASAPDVIEDIVQETLLAIHQKRHTWREDMAVRPWLYAIVRYKVVDAFRARGRRVQVPIEDFAEVLPAEAGPDPTERGDAERVIGRARPALGADRARDRPRGRQHRRDLGRARHDRDRGAGGAAPGAEAARGAAREDDRMRTDELIRAMAADTERAAAARPRVLPARASLARGRWRWRRSSCRSSACGPDLGAALMRLPVLVKQAFPLAARARRLGAALRLACPGCAVGRWAAGARRGAGCSSSSPWRRELVALPAAAWMPALMGQSNRQCLVLHRPDVAAAARRRALGAPPRRQHPARRSAARSPACSAAARRRRSTRSTAPRTARSSTRSGTCSPILGVDRRSARSSARLLRW